MFGEKTSLLNRQTPLLCCAVIAADSYCSEKGFRQRDISQHLSLLVDSVLNRDFSVQNTQVMRLVSELLDKKYLRKVNRKGTPLYKLTPNGLLALLNTVVNASYVSNFSDLTLVLYTLERYAKHIELVALDPSTPKSLEIDLNQAQSTSSFISKQINLAKRRLEEINDRITILSNARTKAQQNPYLLHSSRAIDEVKTYIPNLDLEHEIQESLPNKLRYILLPLKEETTSFISHLQRLQSG